VNTKEIKENQVFPTLSLGFVKTRHTPRDKSECGILADMARATLVINAGRSGRNTTVLGHWSLESMIPSLLEIL
jgi:hypothetical protein